MSDTATLQALAALGMDELSFRALALLPLVQVAWADGTVQQAEADLIRKVAAEKLSVGDEGMRLLENWLAYPPTREYFQHGRTALAALLEGDPEGMGTKAADVLALSRKVAQAAGGLFGIGSISKSESEALGELAEALGVKGAGAVTEAPRAEDILGSPLERVTITITTSILDIAAMNGVLEPDSELGLSMRQIKHIDAKYESRLQEGGTHQRVPVTREGVTLGSAEEASIVIDADPTVAGLHARVYEADRKYYVRDLDSETGTFVNGERVRERRLLGGESIRVGKHLMFKFKMLRRVAKSLV